MSAWLWLWFSTAFAVDHSPWQGVLDRHRNEAAEVDYAAVRQTGALDDYLKTISNVALPQDPSQQMAFWINAYNAVTVDLIADHWPLRSIRDLDGGEVWRTRRFVVAGSALTLDEIEKKRLSPNREPRIHFVLNCAAVSCPPLLGKALTGATLNAQLENASRAWAIGAGLKIDRSGNRAVLSTLFDWYAGDFETPSGVTEIPGLPKRLMGAIHHLAGYQTAADKAWLLAGGYTVEFEPYSWSVNSSSGPR